MAIQNLTRKNHRHQKQDVSVFTTDLDYAVEVGDSADVFQLFTLPPESMVITASLIILTASDAATTATADLGFAGDATLIDDADLTSAAGTNLDGGLTPLIKETGGIVTYTPTYTGATTEGKVKVLVEYIEYNKTTGEVTNFSET